jgi:diguanylate cyclase (GGDEF)-like protein
LVFALLIWLRKTVTARFTAFVFFGQFAVWLVMYTVWLLVLRETRVMALFFALMALAFSLAHTRMAQSMAITLGTSIIQIAGSYWAIHVLQQPGSFALEVFYTFCFLPSALFICGLSGQYAKQRVEIKEAKGVAERNSSALSVEMGKVQDVNAELEKALTRIEELAVRDELTGLYNRRYLMDALEREKTRADRSGRLFSVVMLDIDHFKRINDNFGHQQGDVVLKAVSKAAQDAIRSNDFCARYGGEEFLVVLEELPVSGARACTERLRKSVEALTFPELGDDFHVTISLGYTQYRQSEPLAQTIARADAALYRAKHSGRNRVEFD